MFDLELFARGRFACLRISMKSDTWPPVCVCMSVSVRTCRQRCGSHMPLRGGCVLLVRAGTQPGS